VLASRNEISELVQLEPIRTATIRAANAAHNFKNEGHIKHGADSRQQPQPQL